LDLKLSFFRQKRRTWIQECHFSAKNGDVGFENVIFGPKTPFLTGKIAIPDRVISFNRLKTGSLG
jgi:hypothetical protein